jgi:hypothetical protein
MDGVGAWEYHGNGRAQGTRGWGMEDWGGRLFEIPRILCVCCEFDLVFVLLLLFTFGRLAICEFAVCFLFVLL